MSRGVGRQHGCRPSLGWAFFCFLIRAVLAKDSRHFRAPVFKYQELHELAAPEQDRLSAALREQGFLSIVDAPGYADSEALALRAAVECLERPEAQGQSASVELPDLTSRSTLAASALGTSEGGALPDWTKASCPDLADAVSELRRAAGLAVSATARAADKLPGVRRPRLHALVDKGEHLEHFHRYQVSGADATGASGEDSSSGGGSAELGPATLELHTDAGLLLVMSPGLWMTSAGASSESVDPVLEVQLADGRTLPLSAPKGSVLVIIGQGMVDWLPEYRFRAVPHALRLSSVTTSKPLLQEDGPLVRAWYGRMVFPPQSFVIGRGVTFGAWHTRAKAAMSDLEAVGGNSSMSAATHHHQGAGCLSQSVLKRRLQDLSGSCGAGQIYCWLQCTSVEHLPCGESAQCIDRTTKVPCVTHGQGCEPQCPAAPVSSNLLVSKAGVQRVEGEYSPDTANSAGRWEYRQLSGSAHIQWDMQNAEWILFDTNHLDGSTLYWCAEDRDEPWLCSWQAADGIPSPAPIVARLAAAMTDDNAFCNGMVTDMHMSGFLSSWDDERPHSPCLVMFFTEWKLDSHGKFFVALLGSIFAGVACEALLKLRVWQNGRKRVRKPLLAGLCNVILYAVHRCVGYLAMLLAMTYQTEIFLAVLLGLSIGYGLFNMKQTVHEGETACCNTTFARKKRPGQAEQSLEIVPRGAGNATAQFNVQGMTCRSCSTTVENRLMELPGVENVVADHVTGRCDLQYSAEAKVDVKAVHAAVEELGYEVHSKVPSA
mmetsp:Transcript_73965/g.176033  ORF Transcript_73965/g.176033 Transcript_73965/m.176033 type:complete len:772 (+) Transcript_73965:80-2395(+)